MQDAYPVPRTTQYPAQMIRSMLGPGKDQNSLLFLFQQGKK